MRLPFSWQLIPGPLVRFPTARDIRTFLELPQELLPRISVIVVRSAHFPLLNLVPRRDRRVRDCTQGPCRRSKAREAFLVQRGSPLIDEVAAAYYGSTDMLMYSSASGGRFWPR
jgi:hypothetical protein